MSDLTDIPEAWRDLIEGLTLLATHQNNERNPFHCSHDELMVMADPAAFTDDEIEHLRKLGFIANQEYQTFYSHRFGSA